MSDGVTVGAGHSFDDVYVFAETNNITVVGGSSKTVGAAGGWLTGGGHSALTNTFGLGVDNALQIKAVLPNGKSLIFSICHASSHLLQERISPPIDARIQTFSLLSVAEVVTLSG